VSRSQPPAPARRAVARSPLPALARPALARAPSPARARRVVSRSQLPAPGRALARSQLPAPTRRGGLKSTVSRAGAGVARDVWGLGPRRGLSPAPERWLRCRVRSGSSARVARSFPRSEGRRRLAALAVHVASAKVLLGRQQIVGRTPKLQVVHGVRAAQRVRFAVVQLQAARLRTASSARV